MMLEKRPAHYTYGPEAGAYYLALGDRRDPPYLKQVRVGAILDVADDGTLAGVEIIDTHGIKPPSPK